MYYVTDILIQKYQNRYVCNDHPIHTFVLGLRLSYFLSSDNSNTYEYIVLRNTLQLGRLLCCYTTVSHNQIGNNNYLHLIYTIIDNLYMCTLIPPNPQPSTHKTFAKNNSFDSYLPSQNNLNFSSSSSVRSNKSFFFFYKERFPSHIIYEI
jgi:hypothetical protein